MTLSELADLIRWGWANDREAALIPLFMLATPTIAALLLEAFR